MKMVGHEGVGNDGNLVISKSLVDQYLLTFVERFFEKLGVFDETSDGFIVLECLETSIVVTFGEESGLTVDPSIEDMVVGASDERYFAVGHNLNIAQIPRWLDHSTPGVGFSGKISSKRIHEVEPVSS